MNRSLFLLPLLMLACGPVFEPVSETDSTGGSLAPGGNQPPTAVLVRSAPMGSVFVGAMTVLDATASSDPEQGPLTFHFSVMSGGGAAPTFSATGGRLSMIPTHSGLIAVNVLVTDDHGLTAQAAITFDVLPTGGTGGGTGGGMGSTGGGMGSMGGGMGSMDTCTGGTTCVPTNGLAGACADLSSPTYLPMGAQPCSTHADCPAQSACFHVPTGNFCLQTCTVVRAPTDGGMTAPDAGTRGDAGVTDAGMASNRPPTARITGAPADRTYQPATYTLDALTSSDPDGDALSFEWRVIDRPYGSAVPLTATGAAFQLTTDLAGDYAVQLTVTDARGLRAMADVVFDLTLNGQRCVAPLPQWGFTDYQFDAPLLNSDIIRVAAGVANGLVDLRLQFCRPPFPYVATQVVTWCFNHDGDPDTGSACGTGGPLSGAEAAVMLTRVASGGYALQVGSQVIDACSATRFDPATNTLRVQFDAALVGTPATFDYFVHSSFSGRHGAGMEWAPQAANFLGNALSPLTSLPAFNGSVSLCDLRP